VYVRLAKPGLCSLTKHFPSARLVCKKLSRGATAFRMLMSAL